MLKEVCRDKKKKYIVILLLVGSFLAALKCIFVSLQMDEEYAVSMSYRLLLGDRLFAQIWDPHQTSAFLIEFLMWIYLKIFHTTTCSVIFIRTVGVLIQLAIAYYLYRMLCYLMEPEHSFYLAVVYFNLLPKTYVMPEFSNMMAWGLTMLLLSLFRLAILQGRIVFGNALLSGKYTAADGNVLQVGKKPDNQMAADGNALRGEKEPDNHTATDKDTLQAEKRRKRKIIFTVIEAGLWLSFVVLSYPTCLLLFPFIIWYLWKYDSDRKKTIAVFAGTCLAAGGLYMAYLFSYMTLQELLANIQSLIASCGSHSGGIQKKLGIYGVDFLSLLPFALGYFLVAVIAYRFMDRRELKEGRKESRGKGKGTERTAEGGKTGKNKRAGLLYRIGQMPEEEKLSFIYVLLITSFGLQFLHWILMLWEYESSYPFTVYFFMFGIGFCYLKKLPGEKRETAILWLGANVVMYIAILLLTNLTLFTSIKYLMTGVIMCVAVLMAYTKEKQPEVFRKYTAPLLITWCLVAVFVKGWAYTDNDGLMKNITCVGNILSAGPGKGIFTEYMQGYMQECNYEEFRTYIEPGENLLALDSNTLCYMYQDVNIASSTTICTPSFDENLLDYWERNPEKYPDVIAVQCWYGELKWDQDSWIMHWIENEFGATQVVDGSYFRYYIRRP